MLFLKRLGFYLIGVSLGLVFLAFFFKEKKTEFCYSPNCRVLKNIRSKSLEFNPEIQQLIDNNTINEQQLKLLLTDGNIVFSKSDTKSEPCKTYLIEGEINEQDVEVMVKNCPSEATVTQLKIIK